MIRDHSDFIKTLGDSTGLRSSSNNQFASSNTCLPGKIYRLKFKNI